MIRSLWFEDVTRPQREPLEHDVSVDVAVLGAGIVGLTTALLLERQGASVAVLEGAARGGRRQRLQHREAQLAARAQLHEARPPPRD